MSEIFNRVLFDKAFQSFGKSALIRSRYQYSGRAKNILSKGSMLEQSLRTIFTLELHFFNIEFLAGENLQRVELKIFPLSFFRERNLMSFC